MKMTGAHAIKRMAIWLDRISAVIEVIAALSLALVTVLIFASAIGRYLFAMPIPDSFDISRFLLGVAVMWGLAVLGFRGGHISVDIVAEAVPSPVRRWMDIVAQTVLLAFTVLLAWKIQARVAGTLASGEATFDLRLPVWPFLGLIWLGVVAAVLTTFARLLTLLTGTKGRTDD